MSYSYECTVTCDGCKKERISGEPTRDHFSARYSAGDTADSKGWLFTENKWFCPDCAKKVKVDK